MAAVWGPKPDRERKRSRSPQAFIQIQHFRGSFHWEAVCRKHISRESHLKSWCACYDWWLLWLCVVYNHNSRDRTSVLSEAEFSWQKKTRLNSTQLSHNALKTLKPCPLTGRHRWAWQHLTPASVCSASAVECSDSCTKGLWHVRHDSPTQRWRNSRSRFKLLSLSTFRLLTKAQRFFGSHEWYNRRQTRSYLNAAEALPSTVQIKWFHDNSCDLKMQEIPVSLVSNSPPKKTGKRQQFQKR